MYIVYNVYHIYTKDIVNDILSSIIISNGMPELSYFKRKLMFHIRKILIYLIHLLYCLHKDKFITIHAI